MIHTLFRSLVLATCLLSVLAGTATLLLPLVLEQPPLLVETDWQAIFSLTAFGSYLLLLALDWQMIRQRHSQHRKLFS